MADGLTLSFYDGPGNFRKKLYLPRHVPNFTGVPGSTQDANNGYNVLSMVADKVAQRVWVCADNTPNAAQWTEIVLGGGGGAPTNADYLVKTANGSLSAERVVTDTATITWDWSTAGLAKANFAGIAVRGMADMKWSTGSTAPPGLGNVTFTSGDPTTATSLYVSTLDRNSAANPLTAAFNTAAGSPTLGYVRFVKEADPTVWIDYAVTSRAFTIGYFTYGVAYQASNGTLANADSIQVMFSRTGETGAAGSSYAVFGASGGSHSTGLVPDPGGSAGTTRYLREDATFAVPPDTVGPTYSDFVGSGASHAHGLVPDPGSTAGTTKFLREDATFAVPPGTSGTPSQYNSAVAAASGYTTDTYVVGTGVAVPTAGVKQKTQYYAAVGLQKTTAAGIAAIVLNIRFGTGGVVGDASICTLTFNAQTAVADEGVMEVWATFESVGAGTAAVVRATARLTHRLTTTGLSTAGAVQTKSAAGAGFNSTVAGSIMGISINAGASVALTTDVAQASLNNLP